MDYVGFTLQKLDSVRREIDRIKRSDFPYEHSKECLTEVQRLFQAENTNILALTSKTHESVRQAACLQANSRIYNFHWLLGFILRSTNLRNAFEFFDPILRLSRSLMGADAKLLLSSEWMFSPFTFAQVFSELPNFVFIGLPASESSNSLTLPAAGHELGHNIWRSTPVGPTTFQPLCEAGVLDVVRRRWTDFVGAFGRADPKDLTTDMVLISYWSPALDLTVRQCEEIFCDAMGVRLFGPSYLHAFEYLIAPNLGPGRAPHYPAMAQRIRYMIDAAQRMGHAVPSNYTESFTEIPVNPGPDRRDKFLIDVADEVTDKLVPQLITAAIDFANSKSVEIPSIAASRQIEDSFKMTVPASTPQSLADIVNAAWSAYLDDTFWSEDKVPKSRRFDVLNELTLKTIEVYEFRAKTSGP